MYSNRIANPGADAAGRSLRAATRSCAVPAALMLAAGIVAAQTQKAAPTAPPGADKSVGTRVLETGAKLLQSDSPLGPMDIYLVGFHPMKDDPSHQVEAHHYCHQVNEDFAQCVLFDGSTKTANLTGIEYIVSEKLFSQLPPEEKKFWHPHNYEILSGQLVAPGLPDAAEHALMKTKINSYGKTWHVWQTGSTAHPGAALPLGEPALAWSFNRDGEAQPELVQQRDRKLGVSTDESRRNRADLVPLAHPQQGVDALKAKFPQATPIPGVVDATAR